MSCMDVCAAYAIEPWIQLTMLEKNNEKTRDLIAFLSIILFKNFKFLNPPFRMKKSICDCYLYKYDWNNFTAGNRRLWTNHV